MSADPLAATTAATTMMLAIFANELDRHGVLPKKDLIETLRRTADDAEKTSADAQPRLDLILIRGTADLIENMSVPPAPPWTPTIVGGKKDAD